MADFSDATGLLGKESALMEQIKQAVDRAKAGATSERLHPMATPGENIDPPSPMLSPLGPMHEAEPSINRADVASNRTAVALDWSHLERHRIVSHNVTDPRAKTFHMLRTQLLQAMDQKKWQFLAVTSPTPGCGKTVTAINLALSIARQPGRSALLIDMDLQRPAVAKYLGIKCRQGLHGVLEGRTRMVDAVVRAHADCELMVLPAEAATLRSSELLASRTMDVMLQDIRRTFRSQTVIFDMPPLLSGDDVLATLPRIDCVLLVTAVGVSTLHEIKECNRHLQSAEVVRVVLNKAQEPTARYYY